MATEHKQFFWFAALRGDLLSSFAKSLLRPLAQTSRNITRSAIRLSTAADALRPAAAALSQTAVASGEVFDGPAGLASTPPAEIVVSPDTVAAGGVAAGAGALAVPESIQEPGTIQQPEAGMAAADAPPVVPQMSVFGLPISVLVPESGSAAVSGAETSPETPEGSVVDFSEISRADRFEPTPVEPESQRFAVERSAAGFSRAAGGFRVDPSFRVDTGFPGGLMTRPEPELLRFDTGLLIVPLPDHGCTGCTFSMAGYPYSGGASYLSGVLDVSLDPTPEPTGGEWHDSLFLMSFYLSQKIPVPCSKLFSF